MKGIKGIKQDETCRKIILRLVFRFYPSHSSPSSLLTRFLIPSVEVFRGFVVIVLRCALTG
jgi:hypothetical protein